MGESVRIFFKRAFIVLLFPGIVSLFLGGCEKQKVQAPATREAAVSPAGSDVGTTETNSGGEKFSVSISPKTPTVEDDLRALVRGHVKEVSFVWERNGSVVEEARTDTLPKGSFRKGDEISVTAQTERGEGSASVSVVDCRPRILSVPFKDPHLRHGADIVVEPDAFDADGDPVSFHYSWSVNDEAVSDDDSPVLAGDRFQKGDRVRLSVTPSDGEVEGYPFDGLDLVIPDAPPRFTSNPPLKFSSAVYHYTAQATDPDGDNLTYSLEAGPPGMTVDSESGEITWPVSNAGVEDVPVKVVAADDEGMKAYQTFSLRVAPGQGGRGQ
jgi:hypothetical protein